MVKESTDLDKWPGETRRRKRGRRKERWGKVDAVGERGEEEGMGAKDESQNERGGATLRLKGERGRACVCTCYAAHVDRGGGGSVVPSINNIRLSGLWSGHTHTRVQ